MKPTRRWFLCIAAVVLLSISAPAQLAIDATGPHKEPRKTSGGRCGSIGRKLPRQVLHGTYNEYCSTGEQLLHLTTFPSRVALVAFFLSLAGTASGQQSPLCKSEGVTVNQSSQRVSILVKIVRDRNLRQTDPSCVAMAIRKLGDMRATQATKDLVELLSFKAPKDEVDSLEEKGIVFRPAIPARYYPAIGALFQIGPTTLPQLAKAIEGSPSGSIQSDNATHALMAIFRESPNDGIKYLREAAVKTSTPDGFSRLNAAADMAQETYASH